MRRSWSTSSARHWLFLASEPEIPEGGDYRTYQIGPWPIFVLRRDDGSIAAFHNTCRHRGSRILQQDSRDRRGHAAVPLPPLDLRPRGPGRRLRWHRRVAGGAAPAEAGARAARSPDSSSCASPTSRRMTSTTWRRACTPYLAPHGIAHTKVARQVDIIEHGNWKLTIENNRECFHCAGHPELLVLAVRFLRRDRRGRACRPPSAPTTSAIRRRARRSRGIWKRRRAAVAARSRSCTAAPTALSHRAPGARWRRRVDDPRHARRLAPPARRPHRAAPRHAALPHPAERLVPLPVRSRRSPSPRCRWSATARWCAAPGWCTRMPRRDATTIWTTSPASGTPPTARTRTSSPRRSAGCSAPPTCPGRSRANEYMVQLFHTWYDERLRAALAL